MLSAIQGFWGYVTKPIYDLNQIICMHIILQKVHELVSSAECLRHSWIAQINADVLRTA